MPYKLYLILFLALIHTEFFSQIRILTFHYNKADFLELQYLCLKKFLKDDFELIVFNDAKNATHEEEIKQTCSKYNLQHVRFQPEWHLEHPINILIQSHLNDPSLIHSHVSFINQPLYEQPSLRHCHIIQYALDNYGYDHNDIVVILDGDAFPIRAIDLRKQLKNYHIIGSKKYIEAEKLQYLWVPFIAFDPQKLPNVKDLKFHIDRIGNYIHDSGAHSYHYLRNNPDVKVKFLPIYSSTTYYHYSLNYLKAFGFLEKEAVFIKTLPWPNCVEFHCNRSLLHFGASTFNVEGNDIKAKFVKNFLKDLLNQ